MNGIVQTSVAFGLYKLTKGDCSSVDGRGKQFGIWRRSRSPRRQLHEEGGEEEMLQEDPVVEECAEVVEVVAEREEDTQKNSMPFALIGCVQKKTHLLR